MLDNMTVAELGEAVEVASGCNQPFAHPHYAAKWPLYALALQKARVRVALAAAALETGARGCRGLKDEESDLQGNTPLGTLRRARPSRDLHTRNDKVMSHIIYSPA